MKRFLAISTVALAGLVLSGCSVIADLSDGDDAQQPEGETTDVFTLQVGDCVNDDPTATSSEVSDVPTVDCAELHDNEIYDSVILPDGDFPGDEAIQTLADEACIPSFGDFVGIPYEESTELDYFPFTPTEDGWNNGDHEILCVVYRFDTTDGTTVQVAGTLEGAQI
ncbi:MAG TPA: septum formation family protein [Glaciihabitans sp.]|nr:septum formation family protein [Glaciihabitans sp.]